MRFAIILKLLILGIVLLLCGGSAYAKKMYRMVDENGNVYFSDQVPPEQAKNQRETLSNKARVLDTVEKAKTPEQIEEDKKLNALRLEQEKIIAKQAANDKVLLSTFRSLEDMNRMMENKLAGFDAEQKLIEGNIKRFEQQLQQQQKQAANHERNAEKVPEKLLADIVTSRQQIDSAKKELERQKVSKQSVLNEIKADMERFKFLTASADTKTPDQTLGKTNGTNTLGLFICQNNADCEKAWKISGDYIAKYSTTKLDVNSDKLIMYGLPAKDDDMSFSVSKLQNSSGQFQIFLDVHCKQSSLGMELCASSKVHTIREEFVPFIHSLLASQQ